MTLKGVFPIPKTACSGRGRPPPPEAHAGGPPVARAGRGAGRCSALPRACPPHPVPSPDRCATTAPIQARAAPSAYSGDNRWRGTVRWPPRAGWRISPRPARRASGAWPARRSRRQRRRGPAGGSSPASAAVMPPASPGAGSPCTRARPRHSPVRPAAR